MIGSVVCSCARLLPNSVVGSCAGRPEEGRDASRDRAVMQKFVWQFRLSKAGRPLCALAISNQVASDGHRREDSASSEQRIEKVARKNASRGGGRARQDLKSGGRDVGAAHGFHGQEPQAVDPTHFFARMLLREPRASLADPAGGNHCHQQMPDEDAWSAAFAKLTWPGCPGQAVLARCPS